MDAEPDAVTAARFRPNLVISSCAEGEEETGRPYEEDAWKAVAIGDIARPFTVELASVYTL